MIYIQVYIHIVLDIACVHAPHIFSMCFFCLRQLQLKGGKTRHMKLLCFEPGTRRGKKKLPHGSWDANTHYFAHVSPTSYFHR